MTGKHNIRPILAHLLRSSAQYAMASRILQTVRASGRRDPVRSWYTAGAVLVVVFVVVTSVGVISGRTGRGADPVLVLPVRPTIPVLPVGDVDVAPAATSPTSTPAGAGVEAIQQPGRTVALGAGTGPDDVGTGGDEPGNVDEVDEVDVPGRPGGTPSKTGTGAPQAPGATPTRPTPGQPQPTTRPPAPTTQPPKPGRLAARYTVTSSWKEGFVTNIEITNNTDREQAWSVKIIHPRPDGVRVKELWNATLKQGGATTNVFTGAPLRPGATLTFGFKATKWVSGPVLPTQCSVRSKGTCQVG